MKWTFNPIVLILLVSWPLARADYECLCSYAVESPVYEFPSKDSEVVGFLYEFDCKPVFQQSNQNGFESVQFENQIGYIHLDNTNEVQLCQGIVPKEDKVTTTIPQTTTSKQTDTSTTSQLSTTTSIPQTTTIKQTDTSSKSQLSTTKATISSTIKSPLISNTITKTTHTVPRTSKANVVSTTNHNTMQPTLHMITQSITGNTSKPMPLTTNNQTIANHKTETTTTPTIQTTNKTTAQTTTNKITQTPIVLSTILQTTHTQMTKQTTTNNTTQQKSQTITDRTIKTTKQEAQITTTKPTQSTRVTTKATTTEATTQLSTKSTPQTAAQVITQQAAQTSTKQSTQTSIKLTSQTTTKQTTQTTTTLRTTSAMPSTSTARTAVTSTLSPTCRSGWVMHHVSCYLFKTNHRRTWNDAKSDCSRNNGYLVMIESKDEDTFLRNQLSHRIDTDDGDSDSGVWTGGSDAHNEGHWTWHNTQTGHETQMSFKHWYPGEPDAGDHEHEEDCVCMIGHKGFLWQDYSCDKHMYYVCEAAPTSHPQHQSQTPVQGNACDDGWDLHGNSCYLFHTGDHVTWDTAAHVCQQNHGHLAFIETQDENTYLVSVLKQRVDIHTDHDTDTGVWVGGTDHDVEGKWVWHNQATGVNTPISGYDNWHPGEPDAGDHDHDEDCMCFIGSKNFDWEDYSCQKNMYYICEKELQTHTVPVPTKSGLSCAPNWVLFQGSCYLFSTSAHKEWDEAATHCRHDNAYLVIIDSLDEEQFIAGELDRRIGHESNNRDGAWTGGTDEHHDGYWVWKNTLTNQETDISGYTKWLNGKTNPVDDPDDEDCLAIFKHTNFQWQAYRCRNNIYYVCEKPAMMPGPSLIG